MFSEKSTRCMSSKQITCGSPERSTLGMKVSQKKAVRLKNEPCYCRFLRLIYHIRSNIFKRTHHTTKCFCTLFNLIQWSPWVVWRRKIEIWVDNEKSLELTNSSVFHRCRKWKCWTTEYFFYISAWFNIEISPKNATKYPVA